MKQLALFSLAASFAATLTACTIGQTTAPGISSVNVGDPNYSKLQFAVGTANIYGALGLNVVSTLRQPNGTSAVGVSTPTITGPFTFAAPPAPANGALADPYTTLFPNVSLGITGPSLPETSGAAPAITGTPQSFHVGTPFCDGIGAVPGGFTSCPTGFTPTAATFGQSGGVFAMGLAPYNHIAAVGQSYSYVPYRQPMYHSPSSKRIFIPWGGPPAFDPNGNGTGMRDGLSALSTADSFGFPYFLGVGEGITAFEGVTPTAGATPYTLSVFIAFFSSNGTPQSVTLTANATLNTTIMLPAVSTPLVTPDGTGGATFTAVVPGPVTEAYIQIVDYGPGAGPNNGGGTAPNCQGAKGTSFAPVYYTVHVTASGPVTLTNLHGPNTALTGTTIVPSPTICTAAQNVAAGALNQGDNFTVQMIGFDYPAYQAALSLTQPGTPQAPLITGPGGQSDITISIPTEEDAPGYGAVPLASVGGRIPLARSSRSFPGLKADPDLYRKLGIPNRL